MRKDDLIRLRHMLDAAREAMAFAHNQSRASLDTNRMLTLAIVKSLEILGEAASKVSGETQDSLSQIPWSAIVSMRNRLIHGYYDVNLEIVWKTVTEDLPHLTPELKRVIAADCPDT